MLTFSGPRGNPFINGRAAGRAGGRPSFDRLPNALADAVGRCVSSRREREERSQTPVEQVKCHARISRISVQTPDSLVKKRSRWVLTFCGVCNEMPYRVAR